MKRGYYSFSEYVRERFQARVQRISVNAGFSCPNRDGTLGEDGCFFCNEKGFSRFAQTSLSLKEQIESSRKFYRERFHADKFIVYFQNAANTNAGLEQLRSAYDVIRDFPDVVGLFISTRPDCVDDEKLDLIATYGREYEVWLEYGLQSIHEKTLKAVNRRHTLAHFLQAVEDTAKRGIKSSAHVILGLPGETRDDMIETARTLAGLPVSGVKLHVFHVLRETRFHEIYKAGGVRVPTQEEYVRLACDFLEHLKPDCVIMRLVSNASEDVLVAPSWINRKQKVLSAIDAEFKRRGARQGSKYRG